MHFQLRRNRDIATTESNNECVVDRFLELYKIVVNISHKTAGPGITRPLMFRLHCLNSVTGGSQVSDIGSRISREGSALWLDHNPDLRRDRARASTDQGQRVYQPIPIGRKPVAFAVEEEWTVNV